MSEELLVRHCSPTLAGMKTGNLFTCSFSAEDEMKECVQCWNRILTKKGLRVLSLRFQNGRALIYVYRPARLNIDLHHNVAEQLLKERGCMWIYRKSSWRFQKCWLLEGLRRYGCSTKNFCEVQKMYRCVL